MRSCSRRPSTKAGPDLKVGDRIALSIGGQPPRWTMVGVVREIGGGGAYVRKAAYDAACRRLPAAAGIVRVTFVAGASRRAAIAERSRTAFGASGLPVERARR